MRATPEQAKEMIKEGDYEEQLPAMRRDKRRVCVFCGQEIPPHVTYYTHFEYPYMPDQLRWYACYSCFNRVKEELKRRLK